MYFYRGLGPLGPGLVRKYTSARFGSYSDGDMLTEEESRLLTGSVRSDLMYGDGFIHEI